ncbi:uncharacterized protein LOC127244794 [Andrographis paniculata]|uniref:uncharacterized protein LOC127244794 n=1 Tax=Andrographis paniculata TaxID=175694 RepID=UPI0021E79D7F|nr:uncharacterized protein LOC127244794 [Andrographis paniculata]
MQTKKKATVKNSRELASQRVSRQQKKLVDNVQVQAKKVTELITSSARKKIVVSKAVEEPVDGTNLESQFRLADANHTNIDFDYYSRHGFDNSFVDKEDHGDGTTNCSADTIFSPSFHMTKSVVGGEISSREDFYKYFQHGNQQFPDYGKENVQIDCPGGGALQSEVSSTYPPMKNSNLECSDENNQDHMSAEVHQENDDAEECDDFDPYFFIKNLPDLSTVVPTFRPLLLPKQTRSCPSTSLVLDLDETLVHSSLEPCNDADFTFTVNFNMKDYTVYVRCRPYLVDFLERVSKLFEIIIFTASQSIYAEQLLNVLDPKRKIFRHRVYRDSCVFVDGNYLKDLSVLGRDLSRVIIIDNSPQAFGFQVDNGIPIESWFDDRSDRELLSVIPFLESLVGVQDVRPVIAKKFNLREKIAAAVCPSDFNGEPLGR